MANLWTQQDSRRLNLLICCIIPFNLYLCVCVSVPHRLCPVVQFASCVLRPGRNWVHTDCWTLCQEGKWRPLVFFSQLTKFAFTQFWALPFCCINIFALSSVMNVEVPTVSKGAPGSRSRVQSLGSSRGLIELVLYWHPGFQRVFHSIWSILLTWSPHLNKTVKHSFIKLPSCLNRYKSVMVPQDLILI